MERYQESRAARYRVGKPDQGSRTNWDLLDDLMTQVPGRNNYPGRIKDNLFGDITLPYTTKNLRALNVAYYHRTYRVSSAGAMGLKVRHRGFSDENLFVAQTTQPKVVSLEVESCTKSSNKCKAWEQRWSYAIPLEIIYMTPLSRWNPHKIAYRGDARTEEGKSIFDGPSGRRNGKRPADKAYNGTNSKLYYRTPSEFFGNEMNADPADTTKSSTFVLDAGSNVRQVRASGHRIFLPEIPGVGVLRQRYPIMPVYGEGGSAWKELEALKDIVLEPSRYKQMFRDGGPVKEETEIKQYITAAAKPEYGSHKHHFQLSTDQLAALDKGSRVYNVITEEVRAHSHNLTLVLRNKNIVIKFCDGKTTCFDGHGRWVSPA